MGVLAPSEQWHPAMPYAQPSQEHNFSKAAESSSDLINRASYVDPVLTMGSLETSGILKVAS